MENATVKQSNINSQIKRGIMKLREKLNLLNAL